jgi:hypothetical protein
MRGILSALCQLALVTSLSISPAAAGTIPVAVDFDAESVRLTETDDGVVCVGAGALSTGWFEVPSLPYTTIAVLLPQGEYVVSFRLESDVVKEIIPAVSLEGFGGAVLDDGTVRGLSAPRGELVDKDSIFPRWRVRHTGTSTLHGYRIAVFEVYPVRYQLTTGRLTVDDGMTLVVETSPGAGGAEAIRERHVKGFRERAAREVCGIVANPQSTSAYRFDEIVVDEGDRGFMPAYLPGLEGSAVSYVIITSDAMSAEYQRLADWKTKKGIPTVVRTIEWIEDNYRSGADLGETVRTFIRAAYEKWGVEYVLLGGDTDVIPARFARTTFYTGDLIPTDMYYACLDGDWNADGDSLWGEAYRSSVEPGDYADLLAEVYCGRLPSSTAGEASVVVDKTIAYENPQDRSYQDRVLLLGEVIFPSDYTPGATIILDGAEILESVYEEHLAALPDATPTRLYENYPAYPGSDVLTVTSSKNALNAGTNHVAHAGHGYKYNMSVGNGSLLNYDAFSLTNGDRTFSMYLMNCTNVAFDTDCLAEYFLLNPDGGAFAVTGSSRSAFPSASRPYMDEYYSLIYEDAVVQLGRAFTLSREPFTAAAFGETADRWTHFIYNFLGDPETNMYRGTIDTFVVSAPPSFLFGENPVTITVTSGGAPYDSALVCLHKSGDDYVYGVTDPSGQVTFADFLVRGGGSVTLTVTGLGHARYSA